MHPVYFSRNVSKLEDLSKTGQVSMGGFNAVLTLPELGSNLNRGSEFSLDGCLGSSFFCKIAGLCGTGALAELGWEAFILDTNGFT